MKRPSRFVAAVAAALLVGTTLLITTFLTSPMPSLLPMLPCLPAVTAPSGARYSPAGLAALAEALTFYATTPTTPQQSHAEIALSLAVLRRRAPLRLLVFGLGHDSPLWHALNPGGVTVFLEEDPVVTADRSQRAEVVDAADQIRRAEVVAAAD